MAGYFNIFHILIIVSLLLLSALLIYLSQHEQNRKIFISLVVINFVVTLLIGVFLMFVVDKYTKKAVLEKVTNQRVLINETIVFKGVVRNIGSFDIANCKIIIKLINDPLNRESLKGESLFKPSGLSLFSWMKLGDSKDERPNTVEYKFSIAKNLKAKEFRNFSVSMPYPPYFKKPTFVTKLSCS
ncbi:DUF2393 family protein [Campylobacter sp. MOP7]|uniref:DUF2393 family protein n=1 Tax=Campylobacter canis TaxID=3378588 RepID=UPI00387EB8BC